MARATALLLCAALAALSACGGSDDDDKSSESKSSGTTTSAAPAKKAPVKNGVFQPNDVADCLIDSGVGAAVSLDGADIDLNDAMSQVIVEQGDGNILVYGSASQAAEHEGAYRKSSGSSSEVKVVRNLLVESDADMASADKAKVDACLGV